LGLESLLYTVHDADLAPLDAPALSQDPSQGDGWWSDRDFRGSRSSGCWRSTRRSCPGRWC